MGCCPCGGTAGRLCGSSPALESISVHGQLHDRQAAEQAWCPDLYTDWTKGFPDRVWPRASRASGAAPKWLRAVGAEGSVPGFRWRVGDQIVRGLALS